VSSWTPPPDDAVPRLADLRVSYDAGTLLEGDLAATPLDQFRSWFDEAVRVGLPEPNAMVLASASTADRTGAQPSARTVLLKDVDARGFAFYTNLESRKSRELRATGGACAVFPWFAMHRQVVVVGWAEPIDRDEVAAYFATRPRGSQLGAWASEQSTIIEGRAVLEERYADLERRYPEGSAVPVPPGWGGWLVRPTTVEFWQGRPSRLHDRLRFRALVRAPGLDRSADWVVERLAP
jgi:pyridoxamine 5'-phosphate oxidase